MRQAGNRWNLTHRTGGSAGGGGATSLTIRQRDGTTVADRSGALINTRV